MTKKLPKDKFYRPSPLCASKEYGEKKFEEAFDEKLYGGDRGGKMKSAVDSPSHYNEHGIECVDVAEMVTKHAPDGTAGGYLWNVQKYIWRCWYKGKAIEDLKKAAWYLDRLIKYLEKNHASR